jgi:hypothetical protein
MSFHPLSLPAFDIAPLNELLARTLPDLEAEATAVSERTCAT